MATGPDAEVKKSHMPRLGFVGAGWIGRHRLEAVAASGVAEVAAVADPSDAMREAAGAVAPGAALLTSIEELLALPLDGVMIATPSALHARQSIAALDAGLPVFCQKPLGRTASEVERVVRAAERNDLLLGVDLSYRHAVAFARVREVVGSGAIGDVFVGDLVFHNAYGPDKDWFYDPALSGGGCVIDLGVHLVDMALWSLGFPGVAKVSGRLFAQGRPLRAADRVEDFAVARIDLVDGPTVQISCSWNLPAGRDAEISATFYGTGGGVRVRNLDGSFYDFVAERFQGTGRETIAEPPDEWGGRAAVDWARRLATGSRYDPVAEEFVQVARVIDRIYGR
jgi:predicted dehydrogenase